MPNILLFILLIILILVISFIIINSFGINFSSTKKIGGSEIVTIPSDVTIFPPYREQNIDAREIKYAERKNNTKLIIRKKSFMNATALTELKVPNFITKIDNESFMGCTSLTSIIFEKRPPNNSDLVIGFGAFKNCTSLTELTIPNFVKIISGEAFMGCTSLKSISFQDSIIQSYNTIDYRTIMKNAFKNCPSLTNIHNFPPIVNFYKNTKFDNNEIDKIIEFTYDNPAIEMRTYLNILSDLINNILKTNKIDSIERLKARFLLVEFQKFLSLSLSNTTLYDIIKEHNNIESIINLIKNTIINTEKIKNLNEIKIILNKILDFFIKEKEKRQGSVPSPVVPVKPPLVPLPVSTLVQPVVTPVSTPVQPEVLTPVKPPKIKPVKPPVSTPVVSTPVKLPVSTPVVSTPVVTPVPPVKPVKPVVTPVPPVKPVVTSTQKQIQEILRQKENTRKQEEKQKQEKNEEIFIKKEKNIYNDDYSIDAIDMGPSAQMKKFIKDHKIAKIEIINPHNNPNINMKLEEFNKKLEKGTYIPHCIIYATNGEQYKYD
jgi:hypothetical protein